MSGIARFRHRFQWLASAIAASVQAPAVAWLCWKSQTPWPVLAALVFSVPYLRSFRAPWSDTPQLGTVVALATWTTCVMFDLLALPAWAAIHFGAPSRWVWSAVWILGVIVAADTVTARPRIRRRTIRIENLPAALEGFRIGQLSDVHCGPHASEKRVGAWVRRLNALKLDVAVVTGDLITTGAAYVDAVSRALGGLRAKDGAFVSLGNHDYFTDAEHLVRQLEASGLIVLRNEGRVLARGDAQLYLAGVDDTWTRRANVPRAMKARPANSTAVLLAHDPDLYPDAQAHNVELTLSGHTHGGQLAMPWVQQMTFGRFVSKWPRGLYRKGRSWLYVNSGVGTTGPPARFGAPGEITLLTLTRAL